MKTNHPLENYPAMKEILDGAFVAKSWEYKSADDFIHYGISEELGIALNRELEIADAKAKKYFWGGMKQINWGKY